MKHAGEWWGMLNDGESWRKLAHSVNGDWCRRRRFVFQTTSVSLLGAQLIPCYLREPPGRSKFLDSLREPPGRSNLSVHLREPPRNIASGRIYGVHGSTSPWVHLPADSWARRPMPVLEKISRTLTATLLRENCDRKNDLNSSPEK